MYENEKRNGEEGHCIYFLIFYHYLLFLGFPCFMSIKSSILLLSSSEVQHLSPVCFAKHREVPRSFSDV